MSTIKLNISNVIDIRRSAKLGESSANLASEYNVTRRTIERIITGQLWSSIPEDQPMEYGRYEVTVDGRVWSTAKNSYVSVDNKGNVRLSFDGKKTTLNVDELVDQFFV